LLTFLCPYTTLFRSSSYGYLKSLPVSTIKIDGSFIRDILSDSIDYAMVRSMTEVAHSLGLHVVAEYVESAEILATLRELKVDLAQGRSEERRVGKECRCGG